MRTQTEIQKGVQGLMYGPLPYAHETRKIFFFSIPRVSYYKNIGGTVESKMETSG